MAIWSHRGLAAADSCGTSLLGDLYLYGLSQGIWPTEKDNDGVMHRLLGLDENNNPLDDALLSHELGGPGYTIPGESKVHQNRIASNGVLLPVYGVDSSGNCIMTPVTKDKLLNADLIEERISKIERVVGSLRVDRAYLNYLRAHKSDSKVQLGAPFFFVKAKWEDNEQAFDRINKRATDELLVTNGRFNHLWNNMFHHIRNEYVNKRWPNDLPGTIAEVNAKWADDRSIKNGQVLKFQSGESTCIAVASLQDWVPNGQAFLMFSYPVKDGGNWNFNGYANNIADGYFDGIHPIAALKYSKAKVEVLDQIVELPTYAGRNQIAENQNPTIRDDWQMRELIVQKGLPRSQMKRKFPNIPEMFHGRFWNEFEDDEFRRFFDHPRVRDKDNLIAAVANPETARMPQGMLLPSEMKVVGYPSRELARLNQIRNSIEIASDETAEDDQRSMAFARLKTQLNELLDYPHRMVSDQFNDPEQFLKLLKTHDRIRERFSQRLDSTKNRQMEWIDSKGNLIDHWLPEEIEFAKKWAGSAHDPDAKMILFLKSKQSVGIRMHAGITVDENGQTLSDLFRAEKYQEIVAFLKASVSVRPPSNGDPLVVPSQPDKSAFLTQLKTGVMAGRLAPEEIRLVEDWIADLPVNGQPLPPVESDRMAVKPSFKNHIVQMFRKEDIEKMEPYFDLTDYDAVKAKADVIIDRISRGADAGGLMPPKANGGPWPQEWIDLFKRWKDDGFEQ